MTPDPALHRRADELLESVDGGRPRADQQPQVAAFDVDHHVVVALGPGGHGGRQPETLDETPGEGLRHFGLLIE